MSVEAAFLAGSGGLGRRKLCELGKTYVVVDKHGHESDAFLAAGPLGQLGVHHFDAALASEVEWIDENAIDVKRGEMAQMKSLALFAAYGDIELLLGHEANPLYGIHRPSRTCLHLDGCVIFDFHHDG